MRSSFRGALLREPGMTRMVRSSRMPKHIAVLLGGWSSEREVSLRSGNACADALERRGYRVSRIAAARAIATVLDNLKPDAALLMLHGSPGEGGTLQGVLGSLRIACSHTVVAASALAE